MSDDSQPYSLETLLDWAVNGAKDQESDDSKIALVTREAPTRMAIYGMLAARSNLARVQSLLHNLNSVEDVLLSKLESMSPQQLMALRSNLERDLQTSIDKHIGNKSPTGVTINMNANATSTSVTAPQNLSLTAEQRARVAQVVRGEIVKSSNSDSQDSVQSPTGLRVVPKNG
jgi:hypothetical protein